MNVIGVSALLAVCPLPLQPLPLIICLFASVPPSLQDVNNILTSGEVPNLFPKDELGTVLDEVRGAAKAAGGQAGRGGGVAGGEEDRCKREKVARRQQ